MQRHLGEKGTNILNIDEYFSQFVNKKPSKYKSKLTTIDNIKFHSKKEANVYLKLKDMQSKNEILYFLCQIPFILPGGVKYIADFMVVNKDGSIEYIDVKGMETREFITKKKIVEAIYPIKIKIWK